MNVRVSFGWLSVLSLLLGNSASAQYPGPGMAAPPYTGGVAPSQYHAPAQYHAPQTYGEWGYPQQAPAYAPPAHYESIAAELVPSDRRFFYDNDSRLDLTFRENLRGAFFRLEYLNAHLDKGNGRILGEPLASPLQDINQPFRVFYPTIPPGPDDPPPTEDDIVPPMFAHAVIPTTHNIDWKNMQGIRGTFGIPLGKEGSIELSALGFESKMDRIETPRLQSPDLPGHYGNPGITFIGTTLTTDGVPGSRIILYDDSFTGTYDADLFTADVNIVLNTYVPQEGISFQPIIGYRHEEYGERLKFGGSFTNVSGYFEDYGVFDEAQSNYLDSKVRNFRHQGQIGFRSELIHPWFRLGVEPKFGLGANVIRSQLGVSTFRNPGNIEQFPDPTLSLNDPASTVTSHRQIKFAPSFDLDVYATIPVRDWLNLRVGYTLMWMGQMGVADSSIRFNETTSLTGPPDPSDPEQTPTEVTNADVVLDPKRKDRIVNAFTIGGEIILR